MPEPESSADRRLIERAARGDRAAVECLLVEELGRLRAFVRLNVDELLRHREASSDLVQSTCREVLEDLGQFDFRGRAAFRSWLYSVTLNKIRDRRRFWLAQRRDPAREVAQPSTCCGHCGVDAICAAGLTPSQQALRQEDVERLEAAFDGLTEAQREVVGLSRIAGLSSIEIAERTGREPGAVRVLLHRALARLSTLLEEPEPRGA